MESLDDPRLRYARLMDGEGGVSMARNRAIELAHSHRLVTLDSDDLNNPHRAARCRELLDPNEAQLIYTRVRLFSREKPSGRLKPILPFSADLER